MGKLIDRKGEVNKNKFGTTMEIIDYRSADNILVKFEEGYITKTAYKCFRNGSVKNVFNKTMTGIGFLGEGTYTSRINDKKTPQYTTWRNMFIRCYDNKYLERFPSYEGCTVDETWHNFQNFGKWYDDNYYEISGEKMALDKDILKKNNKIYSPECCVFVPPSINSLFTKRNAKRGDCPIGVSFCKKSNKYKVACNNGDGHKESLGYYYSSIYAFMIYREFKEKIIKETAEKYKGRIPDQLYNALMTYEVEIND